MLEQGLLRRASRIIVGKSGVWGIRQGTTPLHAEPQGSVQCASSFSEFTSVLWPSPLPGAVPAV